MSQRIVLATCDLRLAPRWSLRICSLIILHSDHVITRTAEWRLRPRRPGARRAPAPTSHPLAEARGQDAARSGRAGARDTPWDGRRTDPAGTARYYGVSRRARQGRP